MSQYNAGGSKGFTAGADLTEGTIVKLDGSSVVAATAGTDVSVGVVTNDVPSGQVADVRLRSAQGTVKVVAGGAIDVNDKVTATTGGAAIATTTAGNEVLGVALEGAASGDLFEVMPTNSNL